MKRPCEICGKTLNWYPSVPRKTCSPECRGKLVTRKHQDKYRRQCETCGVDFVPCRRDVPGRFCSRKCYGAANVQDRVVTENGYVRVYRPNHPNASKQGYVLEHRLVMEAQIGRYLTPDEVVHHKNHDKHDNRVGNLELMTVTEHNSHHAKQQERNHLGVFVYEKGGAR